MNTFTAHGKEWTKHKPGDEMPVDGEARVYVNFRGSSGIPSGGQASDLNWGVISHASHVEIIGWRLADEVKEGVSEREILQFIEREAAKRGSVTITRMPDSSAWLIGTGDAWEPIARGVTFLEAIGAAMRKGVEG